MADAPCGARVRLLWRPQAQFAGLHLAVHRGLDAARGVSLSLSPVDFTRGPIEALVRGEVEFAVASPAHMLESGRAEDLVLLLVVQQASALVYPAYASRGIAAARDLAGRRIAVWPGGEHLELRWMLRRAGVDESSVTWVPATDTVSTLLAAAADCAQATVYHELRHALAGAPDPSAFVVLRARDCDAELVKDGFVTTRRLLRERPDYVDAVVEAVLDGWSNAIAFPDLAVEACLAADPALSRADQADQLASIVSLTGSRKDVSTGLGYPDPRHVERAARALDELGHPPLPPLPGDAVELGPWERACSRLRKAA